VPFGSDSIDLQVISLKIIPSLLCNADQMRLLGAGYGALVADALGRNNGGCRKGK